MSYTINIQEAPERISGLLADMEKTLATVVIMRDNRPNFIFCLNTDKILPFVSDGAMSVLATLM